MTSPLPQTAIDAGFSFYGKDDGTPMFPGFEAYMGPFYYRQHGEYYEFMTHIAPHHVNTGQAAHGGMLAALTDIVCSASYWNYLGRELDSGFVTVNLSHEYISGAPADSWLLMRCQIRQAGGSMIFVDCEMSVEGKLVGLSRCVLKKVKPRQNT